MSTRATVIVGNTDLVDALADAQAESGRTVLTVRPQSVDPQEWVNEVVSTAASADASIEALVFSTIRLDRIPAIGSIARSVLAVIDAVTDDLASTGSGRIVVVGSRDWLGWPGLAEESADMAALVGLTRSLALQLGARGITVNLVCPPRTLDHQPPVSGEDLWAQQPTPPTGVVTTDEVAFAIGFPLDSSSGYFTGQIIHVSGGMNVLSSLTA